MIISFMLVASVGALYLTNAAEPALPPQTIPSGITSGSTLSHNETPIGEGYLVVFTETGLRPGTQWSVTLNKVARSSTLPTIVFIETDGTYTYAIAPVTGYINPPSGHIVVVNGESLNVVTVTFYVVSPPAIYAQANSSILYNYSLPEAQEFIVGMGSGSVPVNYIKLYLYAPGTVNVSIGSYLWGGDLLANITVNVTHDGWYTISFPVIYLDQNTDYYLNLFGVTGNVTWGYANYPATVEVNTLSDFWYDYPGSPLEVDTYYPNFYSVGFNSLPPPPPSSAHSANIGTFQSTSVEIAADANHLYLMNWE